MRITIAIVCFLLSCSAMGNANLENNTKKAVTNSTQKLNLKDLENKESNLIENEKLSLEHAGYLRSIDRSRH